jgi:hypothetical protein
MPVNMIESTARDMYEFNMIPGDFHWDALDDRAKLHWRKKAGALLAKVQSRSSEAAVAEPVASGEVDEWFDGCQFLVTFDGETTHPMKLGLSLADKGRITRMVFECPAPQPQASAEDDTADFAREASRLLLGFMLDTNALGPHGAGENLVRGIKASQRIRASLEVGRE